MTPVFVFFVGLLWAGLFAWYFFTDNERSKRILGSLLTVLVAFVALSAVYPPEEKLALGLDLKGGTSFLVRLKAEAEDGSPAREITPAMLDQAREVIRRRVDSGSGLQGRGLQRAGQHPRAGISGGAQEG